MPSLKFTPLTRLVLALDAELDLANDPEFEAELADKYAARLAEATQERDATLKGVVTLDALLALASSGHNIVIPGIGVNMGDIPALLEILVGLASASACITAISFASWLCYSQLFFVFNNRKARKYNIDPDFINFAETPTKLTVKIFRSKLNFWGSDWHESGRVFEGYTSLYSIAANSFLLGAPLLHFGLIVVGASKIAERSGFDVMHVVFFLWVLIAHLIAVLTWVLPSLGFTFALSSNTRVRA